MKLINSTEYKELLSKLSKANFSKSNKALEATLFLLCKHIELMAPIFKKTPESMLKDISVNIVKDLSDVTPSGGTRYFQLIGKNAEQISSRQYAMANVMKNNGMHDNSIFDNTGLVWCRADNVFKGFIFEEMKIKDSFLDLISEKLAGKNIRKNAKWYIDNVMDEHPIFSSYPKFRDHNVMIKNINAAGSYVSSGKTIVLNANTIKEYSEKGDRIGLENYLQEVIVHELQHAIQNEESEWSRGNTSKLNEQNVQDMINDNRELLSIIFPMHENEIIFINKITEYAKKYNKEDIYDVWDVANDEELDILGELCSSIPDSQRESNEFNIDSAQEELDRQIASNSFDPIYWYQNTVGEIYARFSEDILKRTNSYMKRDDADKTKSEFFVSQFKACTSVKFLSNGIISRDEENSQSLGFIDFYESSQSTISLIEGSCNLSTWIHESLGHYVFENLIRASRLDDAPKWISETMERLNDNVFWNIKDKTAQHEMFSTLTEKYFLSPSASNPPEMKALKLLIEDELSAVMDLRKIQLDKCGVHTADRMIFDNCLEKMFKSEQVDDECVVLY